MHLKQQMEFKSYVCKKKNKNELKNVSLRHRAAKLYYLYKYIFIYKIGIALSSNFHILLFKKK